MGIDCTICPSNHQFDTEFLKEHCKAVSILEKAKLDFYFADYACQRRIDLQTQK
jgi:hypothetical protein